MPRGVEGSHQPTIAVITAQYFEKMAVDAMMTNKQTFMRYATVGKVDRLIEVFFHNLINYLCGCFFFITIFFLSSKFTE